ncbi:hypothetical protein C0J52_14951 [Blattella germanica]|nr:hypothetical protein C0J52_14951 [Blattella germanica]
MHKLLNNVHQCPQFGQQSTALNMNELLMEEAKQSQARYETKEYTPEYTISSTNMVMVGVVDDGVESEEGKMVEIQRSEVDDWDQKEGLEVENDG